MIAVVVNADSRRQSCSMSGRTNAQDANRKCEKERMVFMGKAIKQEDRIIITIPDYEGAGIYMIKNIITGKVYIGSAKNIRKRIIQHDQYMRNGMCNNRFQEDIDKGHKFECYVVEKCDNITRVELKDKESYYVGIFDSFRKGYNIANVATYDLNFYIKHRNKHMVDWLTEIIG